MQARNREFRGQNAERESGRPDFEVGKAGSNPVSASEKGIQEKILYLFLCPATDGFLQIYELEKINRDDWRPAHLQYEGYYQAGQHQGV